MSYYYDYGAFPYESYAYSAGFGFGLGYYLISIAITVLTIVALWMIFKKAGEEGWASLIPFYNQYMLYKITWGNGWYFLLLLIPIANIVIAIITMVKLARVFGKSGGFACGLIFLNTIFMCILAFSKDIVYVGIPGKTSGGYNGGSASAGFQNPYTQSQQSYQSAQAETKQSDSNPNYFYQQSSGFSSAPKYCPQCGQALESDAKFCPFCGKRL